MSLKPFSCFTPGFGQVLAQDLDSRVQMWSTGAGFKNATRSFLVFPCCALVARKIGSLGSTVLGFYLSLLQNLVNFGVAFL